MAHILVVDDEPDVRGSIRRVLERAGHHVTTAESGPDALEQIAIRPPDAVVLDIVMPEMSGIEVCRQIRADPYLARLPIVFLTARGQPDEIAQGLNAGADDYIVKPFEALELPARIRALLRRAPGGPLDTDTDVLRAGELTVHQTRPDSWLGDEHVPLTTTEHRLLRYLVQQAGQPVAVEQCLQDVWQYPPGVGDPALVYTQIAHLRAKLEPDSTNPSIIRNVRGRGYVVGG